MKKNINISWINQNIQNECFVKKLEKSKIIKCSKAYQAIFNGAPFYESWTLESAINQIESYIKEQALILVPEYKDQIIGFLISINGVPNDQKNYVPYLSEQIRYIEEIGVVKDFRKQQIASEMVRILLTNFLNSNQNFLAYRTNAMRYFETQKGESFESGVIRIQQEDIIKRKNNEKIYIPEFSQYEKQKFINQYLELLKYRPDLDVSNSNALFRNIFGSIEFCKIDDNYTFQEDPNQNGNDRIFPIVDLSKSLILSKRRI